MIVINNKTSPTTTMITGMTRLIMSPFMKIISAFSILYKRARNMTWRLYQPPFTWFFNKWKQIEIIKIHAESHEHKQSFIKWIGFKNFLWQIEVLLTQVKSSVCYRDELFSFEKTENIFM